MNGKYSRNLIGLLGGTSWPSTILYYEKLNQIVHKELGKFHSARIFLYSINYNDIKSSYPDNWSNVESYLKEEIQFLLTKQPSCLIICNNTLHKAFDSLNLNISIPVFHAGLLSAKEAVQKKYRKVLLLGTKFTMEDGFFTKYFEDYGIEIVIPNHEHRIFIQEIQTQISAGVKNDSFFRTFQQIISVYKNLDAICLACTELPLYINSDNCKLPIINPIDLQCMEAVKFYLSN